MLILLFVLVPTLIVAGYAVAQSLRNRQPSSIESGVDAFRREMDALSPHAAPVQRRPGERPPGSPSDVGTSNGETSSNQANPPGAPRRPGGRG